MPPLIDLHTHLLPGVDDGARDVDEARDAVEALAEADVVAALATPHLDASTLAGGEREERLAAFDRAFSELREARDAGGVETRLARGAEIRLDGGPTEFSDDRVRLGSSRAVLVEFASLDLPPFGARQLEEVAKEGWIPVLAHPERYRGVGRKPEEAAAWRQAGALFQVNLGSLVGQYGRAAREAARELVARGWADLLASDYHARGPLPWESARETWREAAEAGSAVLEAWELVTRVNPARLLRDEPIRPVPPVTLDPGLWGRLRGLWE